MSTIKLTPGDLEYLRAGGVIERVGVQIVLVDAEGKTVYERLRETIGPVIRALAERDHD